MCGLCVVPRLWPRHSGAMKLEAWIDDNGALVRSGQAYRQGYSRRAVTEAVGRGTVKRARRTWLYTPQSDRMHVAIAKLGAHLTCVSAAKHYGLWTLPSPRSHIAVPRNSKDKLNRRIYRVHYGSGPLPRPHESVIDRIENVLALVAMCQPLEHATVIAESAIRLGHISAEGLRALPVKSAAFRRVAAEASSLSDSGLETLLRVRLGLLGVTVKQQVRLLGRPVDGLIGERLVIQTDGSTHLTKEQKQRDAEADAQLQLRGFTVLRFTYRDVMSRWDYVEHTILQAIAQGLHRA